MNIVITSIPYCCITVKEVRQSLQTSQTKQRAKGCAVVVAVLHEPVCIRRCVTVFSSGMCESTVCGNITLTFRFYKTVVEWNNRLRRTDRRTVKSSYKNGTEVDRNITVILSHTVCVRMCACMCVCTSAVIVCEPLCECA